MPGRRHARPRGTRTSFMVRWDAECKIGPAGFGSEVSKRGERPGVHEWPNACSQPVPISPGDSARTRGTRLAVRPGFPTDSEDLWSSRQPSVDELLCTTAKYLRPLSIGQVVCAVAPIPAGQAVAQHRSAQSAHTLQGAFRRRLFSVCLAVVAEETHPGAMELAHEIRLKERRETLAGLLRLRFGDLPPEPFQRLAAADLAEVDRWFRRLAAASSWQEVMDE